MVFLTKKQIELGEGFASNELRKRIANLPYSNFFHVAFTDYGGSIIDKIYYEYFLEKHPENIACENTGWSGANAFIFFDEKLGITFKEFEDNSDGYLLFFEDIEEYFFSKEMEEKYTACKDFIKEAVQDGYKPRKGSFHQILELFEKSSNWCTFGIDYSSSEIIKKILDAGLIEKNEVAK